MKKTKKLINWLQSWSAGKTFLYQTEKYFLSNRIKFSVSLVVTILWLKWHQQTKSIRRKKIKKPYAL